MINLPILLKPLPVFLVALATVDAISATTVTAAPQGAETQIDTNDKARAQQAEYAKGLTTAFQQEQRNEAWAKQKEASLRTSFAASGLAPGILKSVECRSSQCSLQLQLGAEPNEASERQTAIVDWLAANETCGFTDGSVPASDRAMGEARVFVLCNKK